MPTSPEGHLFLFILNARRTTASTAQTPVPTTSPLSAAVITVSCAATTAVSVVAVPEAASTADAQVNVKENVPTRAVPAALVGSVTLDDLS